jgi:hypothetical protein
MSGIQSTSVSDAALNCCCACPTQEPTVGRDAQGNVLFENENYTIKVTDMGEVITTNKNTGETYRVWGDPHVQIDGQHAFDYWGTTTFTLDDGTKITMQTTPWAGNEEMTVTSKVTITDGDFGVHITGVDPNARGDLSMVEVNGNLADFVIRDGNTLYENPFGSGFLGVDQNGSLAQVDQAFINGTDEKLLGEFANPYAEMFENIGGLMAISFMGAFLSGFAMGQELNDAAQADNSFLLTLIRSI